jgi:hypothetical protein
MPVLGLIQLNWRGQDVPIEKGGKVKLGGIMQKPVVTGQTVDPASEYEGSEINAVTKMSTGMDVVALFASGQGPLVIKCDTGQTYSWPDAFLGVLAEFTAGDGGKIPLKFHGGTPTQVIAQ